MNKKNEGSSIQQQQPPPTNSFIQKTSPPQGPSSNINNTSTGNFKATTSDKIAQIFHYSGYESRANLHTGMLGTVVNTVYELELLTLNAFFDKLPNDDLDFMHYRFLVDVIPEGGGSNKSGGNVGEDKIKAIGKQNLITWEITQYNFNGKLIYQTSFKNFQVTDLTLEVTQPCLQLEFYIKDLRNGQKYPLNSYTSIPYPITISLRVYNEPFL